jgi:serine/threonine protein phosphatase PrpC
VPTLVLKSTVRSDAGLVRANNEDAAFASPRVAAVADGVGGRAAGARGDEGGRDNVTVVVADVRAAAE